MTVSQYNYYNWSQQLWALAQNTWGPGFTWNLTFSPSDTVTVIILKRKVSVCYFHFQYFAKILYLILFIVLVKFKIQFSWQKIEIWFCFLKLEKDKNILENNISKWNQKSWYPYIDVMNNWQYQKLADLKIMCDVLRTVWFSHFGHVYILMGA